MSNEWNLFDESTLFGRNEAEMSAQNWKVLFEKNRIVEKNAPLDFSRNYGMCNFKFGVFFIV